MTVTGSDGERSSATFDEVVAAAPSATVRRRDARVSRVRTEPTRIDAWWARVLGTPGRRALWYWGGPAIVTLLAAVLRLWNLGHPHALVFDETYYVKDAWTLWNTGAERSWPDGADDAFAAGDVNGWLDDPSYVVHPPLGKWIIGLGMALVGQGTDAVGWRIGTAVVGILSVLLLTLIARRLFSSTALAVVAGGLFAIDGHAIVMSRVALLDTMVMFFALLGFGAVILDREWVRRRLDAWLVRRGPGPLPPWGPVFWTRPWVIAAGVAFGLATSVKWSGLYFLAVFGVYLVVVDALARRRAGIPFFWSAAILKQGPATFLLLVPVALVVYAASWSGWLLGDDGYDRTWADQAGNAWTGPFAWIPTALQSLWHYHSSMYTFHVGLSQPHPYQASPTTWLLMLRPTSMWYSATPGGAEAITAIANPLIWWAAVAVLLFLVYRMITRPDRRIGLVLTGILAGYGPWLLYPERTVFQFYTIAFEPYLLLALVFAIGWIVGPRDGDTVRRGTGLVIVAVFLGVAALLSAFWFPMWTATWVPDVFIRLHYWLPSWI
ncbi:dolichyl-phosphate-mannose--protein mannosyltransferase [Labedella endophytica]|uniref:dolichyl-phosphate-mannose--protein mannosyltransferase n=1 Tax=Labedella endophytica TaxID=1523160 RepID=UPI001FB82F51|nr:phospholipid carrier-dependent glycosyltransferase [Labedella endophytica]